MKRPKPITLPLTDEQAEALAPLFQWLSDANDASGKHGMVFAQVFPDGMKVGVFDHERATRIIAANGQELATTETVRFATEPPKTVQ